jgi:hypothetical protein
LKEKKDCATRTIYQGRIGSETRAVVDLFEKNMVSQGKQFGPAIITLMDKENQRIAGLADPETSTLNNQPEQEGKDYNNNYNNTVTLPTVENKNIQFLKILEPNITSKRKINDREILFCLKHDVVNDYEKFREIRFAALRLNVNAKLVTKPEIGYIIAGDQID